MKLKDSFLTHDVNDSHILLDVENKDFSGIVRTNDTAFFIVECLKTETTKDQIVEKMLEQYNVSADVVSADVDGVIEQLKSINALEL